VKAADLNCAARGDVESPAQALVWDKASENRNISIPVYRSDGTTVIGTFIIGHASGPNVRTVPLSSLSLTCSTTGVIQGLTADESWPARSCAESRTVSGTAKLIPQISVRVPAGCRPTGTWSDLNRLLE
jgi:hypothetical protein